MKRTIIVRNLGLTTLGLWLLAGTQNGCVVPQETGPAASTTVSYNLPVLAPVDPAKQNQVTDGLHISVSPATYRAQPVSRREYRRTLALLVVDGQYPAQMRTTPGLTVAPRDVRFKVTISNPLPHVLRLSDTLVQFQVDGQNVDVPRSSYEGFLSGFIPPRGQKEFEIGGPDLSTVPAGKTIGLFLYDVVTQTDGAGNATKKSNFEFYYTLSFQSKTETLPVTVKEVHVTQDQYRALPDQWSPEPQLDAVIPAQ